MHKRRSNTLTLFASSGTISIDEGFGAIATETGIATESIVVGVTITA